MSVLKLAIQHEVNLQYAWPKCRATRQPFIFLRRKNNLSKLFTATGYFGVR